MQTGETNIALQEQNALSSVGDYILPAGMVDFQTPSEMVMAAMKKVQESPTPENIQMLNALKDGAKAIVTAGIGQTQQMNAMIDLLRVNKEWKQRK